MGDVRRETFAGDVIARYVQALGGEIEVTARFGDRSLRLHLGE